MGQIKACVKVEMSDDEISVRSSLLLHALPKRLLTLSVAQLHELHMLAPVSLLRDAALHCLLSLDS